MVFRCDNIINQSHFNWNDTRHISIVDDENNYITVIKVKVNIIFVL